MSKNKTEIKTGAARESQNDIALAQTPRESAGDTPRSQVATGVETESEGGCCQQRLVLSVASVLDEFGEEIYGTYVGSLCQDTKEERTACYNRTAQDIINRFEQLGMTLTPPKDGVPPPTCESNHQSMPTGQ